MTSNAPGCGTSISSSWKASIGSPKRSSRITQAAIVGGSSPGSTSRLATSLESTATCLLPGSCKAGRDPTHESQPVAPSPVQDPGDDDRGQDQRAALVGEEGGLGVDVVDEVAEVLAEEPGHERPGHEEDRADGHERDQAVEPVGVGVEERVREGAEVAGEPPQ